MARDTETYLMHDVFITSHAFTICIKNEVIFCGDGEEAAAQFVYGEETMLWFQYRIRSTIQD